MDAREESGFTLIELLIVMIIIGLLAAIAIPTFLHQRDQAQRTAGIEDMKNTANTIESYAVDHDGSYADFNGATQSSPILIDSGFKASQWTTLAIVATDSTYCIEGQRAQLPGQTFIFRKTAGIVQIDLTGTATC